MRIGVMQGRLCPPIDGKIQAFPGDCWRDEFSASQKLGLNCIEWIFEAPDVDKNPLLTDAGIADMKSVSTESGVVIGSVVADYFMEKLLFSLPPEEIEKNVEMLRLLVRNCASAGIPIIELPFVDASALDSAEHREEVVKNLQAPLEDAKKAGIVIGFETSLSPQVFRGFLDSFKPYEVRANFDMGNSSSLNFDPAEEIPTLGTDIANVHIKDRVLGGGTVPLGEGNTNFQEVFSQLKALDYSGDFIFQSARQDIPESKSQKGPEETVLEYMDFMKPHLEPFR